MAHSSSSTTVSPPWETYIYTHTEKDIFAPSPYKDRLLPLWRFRTPEIARTSANDIWAAFLEYEKQQSFVGMDNARKFLQMGMGGRKFAAGETARVEANENEGKFGGRKKRQKLEDATGDENWEGRKGKEEASLIFREVWERAKNWEGYVRRRDEFLERQKEWRKERKSKEGSAGELKKRKKRKSKREINSED